MSDLAELIARLESASEGSEELDRAIAEAVIVDGAHIAELCVGEEPLIWHDPRWHKQPIPRFTASIDAARTLVGKGWHVLLTGHKDQWATRLTHGSGRREIGLAKAPALALCIAALKAMSAA